MKRNIFCFISFVLLSFLIYCDPISLYEAKDHVGENVIVQGVVSNVFISEKGNCFLNMGGNYPNQKFTAVIFANFTHLFNDLKLFTGKTIEVKGKIKLYKGKPEIVISSINQINIINDDKWEESLFINIISIFSFLISFPSFREDGFPGGHFNRKTGEYHFHHEMHAHAHPNGICPLELVKH